MAQSIKNSPAMQKMQIQYLDQENPLEKGVPTHSGILARKVGNPLQTEKWSRPSCRNQERRRGSDEVVPGTSVFPLSESGISRNFWGRIKGAKYRFALQDGTWTSLEML